jgi:predicted dehydrogenase
MVGIRSIFVYNKVGLGIVGAGTEALRILPHFLEENTKRKVALIAVCDPVLGRAELTAKQFGISKWYVGYEELLHNDKVDVITLVSPIGVHFNQAMLAVEAGKHIHINKTMTVTRKEADALIVAAEKRGIKITASPGNMLFPMNQRKRKYILEGRLGRLVWAAGCSGNAARYHLNEPSRIDGNETTRANPGWYFKKNGGGPLYDSTVYPLHTMTGVIGPARTVIAVTSKTRDFFVFNGQHIENEMADFIWMLIGFDNGIYGLISAFPTVAPFAFGDAHCVFYGLADFINEEGFHGKESLIREGDMMPHVTEKHAKIGESHVYEDIMQLVDWVGFGGKRPLCSVEHARHVLDIIDGCYESAKTGSMVKIDTAFPLMTLDEIDESLGKYGGNGKSVFAMPNTIAYFLETVKDKQ